LISSPNLTAVIGRFIRAKAVLPQKIKEAVAPGEWISDLRMVAFETLRAVALSDVERDAIPAIMETFGSGTALFQHFVGPEPIAVGGGSAFSLSAFPFSALGKAFDPVELTSNQDFRQRVVDWVAQYKIKDERDTDATGQFLDNAQIASRVAAAIRADPEPWLRTDMSGHGALNPEGLAMITGLTGLTDGQACRMLKAVLAAWAAYVRMKIGRVAVIKIREAFV
jgi:hypothetical protein